MNTWKTPDTPQGWATLAAMRAFHEQLRAPAVRALLQDKLKDGLVRLALASMETDTRSPLSGSTCVTGFLRHFELAMLVVYRAVERRPGLTYREAFVLIMRLPVRFPLKLTTNDEPPESRHYGDIRTEYDEVRRRVEAVKKLTPRSRATRALKLVDVLSGISSVQAHTYLGWRPSDIAWDYVAKKRKLGIGGEALKKLARVARTPGEMFRWAIATHGVTVEEIDLFIEESLAGAPGRLKPDDGEARPAGG